MTDVAQTAEDEKRTLAEKLWRYRMEAGLSQEELAEKSGVAQGAISMLERGERTRPFPRTLKKLSGALDVEIRDLLPSMVAVMSVAVAICGPTLLM
jgi:transcriptional regulator with XRE-family HTH domain